MSADRFRIDADLAPAAWAHPAPWTRLNHEAPVGAGATGIPAVVRFSTRDAANAWFDLAIFI